MKIAVGLFGLVVAAAASAQDADPPTRMCVDGRFDDWAAVAVTATDAAGDASGPFDVTRLFVQSRGTTLYLRFDTGRALNLQTGPDDDVGLEIRVGLPGGARLEVKVRDRDVVLYDDEAARERHIGWARVDYVAAPTYAAAEFEMRLDLGSIGATVGDTITIDFAGSDRLVAPLPFALETPAPLAMPLRPHVRLDAEDVRIVSLNTRRNGLLDADRREALARLIGATAPDVVAIQEEYEASGAQIRSVLARFLPGDGTDRPWNVHKVKDCVVASRHPLVPVPSYDESYAAAVVDTGAARPLLVLSIHPKCCGYIGDPSDERRVRQTHAMIRTIDAVRGSGPGDPFAGHREAAVVVIGDWNLVGSRTPLDLLTAPDGPGRLTHRPLLHLARDSIVTWRDERSSFAPGMLDLVAWDDGRAVARRGFVLDTRDLDEATLAALGLRGDDSTATDHLLLVADFAVATVHVPREGQTR